MASSENQGLQIALIIFVMLTILLSVTTFMFFSQYQDADERSRSDKAEATKNYQALKDTLDEVRTLKEIIGISGDAKLPDVRQMLTDDMTKFAATVPQESRFYHPALEFVSNTATERTTELLAAREAIQKEQDERQQVEAAKQKQVEEAEANARKAEADLASAKQEFEDYRKKMLDDQEDLKRQLGEKNQAYAALDESTKKQIEALAAGAKKLEYTNANLNKKIVDLDPTSGFEVPDGEIVWVDQRSRSAYVNVGESDGLKRQILFSVVAGDENVGNDQRTKGRLEVTKIIGPHFAQCRIIEDHMTDPLVEGDKIYTPLWQPGRADGFGIIGKIDIDHDDLDDRPLLKDLIRLNGGHVDVEDTLEGKQIGELTINTRYLIAGDEPDLSVAGKAYTKLLDEAVPLGVRTISLSKFLDQVGWKNQKQTLLYGGRGNANDVPAEMPDGGRGQATGSLSSGFKARRPLGRRGLGGVGGGTTEPHKPKSAYGK